jgi:hypothetical protein
MQLGVDWSSLEGNQPVMTSFMSYWRPCPCGVCALLGTPHSCLCRTRSRISALGSWQCGMGLTSPPGSWVLGSVADSPEVAGLSCPSLWTDRQLLDELWVSREYIPDPVGGALFAVGRREHHREVLLLLPLPMMTVVLFWPASTTLCVLQALLNSHRSLGATGGYSIKPMLQTLEDWGLQGTWLEVVEQGSEQTQGNLQSQRHDGQTA